jgi:hypothetical protein
MDAAITARHEFRRLPARLAAVVAFMQISSSREYYGCEPTPDLAALDARTTNAVPALYVPEKLKRRECEMSNRPHITPRSPSISGDAMKKPLRRESDEAAGTAVKRAVKRTVCFLMRRDRGIISSATASGRRKRAGARRALTSAYCLMPSAWICSFVSMLKPYLLPKSMP